MFDGSNILTSSGVELERVAAEQFGTAVAEFGKDFGLSSGSTTGTTTSSANTSSAVQGANSKKKQYSTPADFIRGVGSISSDKFYGDTDGSFYAPKSKFMFKVMFVMNAPYNAIFDTKKLKYAYEIKAVEKPRVDFHYEEVNMYNYRTKVLRRIEHHPIQLDFYDDQNNRVMDFVNFYRTAYSPVSRAETSTDAAAFEDSGMNFGGSGTSNGSGVFSSSMEPLIDNSGNVSIERGNMLSAIVVAQIYQFGQRVNYYVFHNPRVEAFAFDQMDMEAGEGHSVSMTFNYDSMYFVDKHSLESTSGLLARDSDSYAPLGKFGKNDVLTTLQEFNEQVFATSTIKPNADANVNWDTTKQSWYSKALNRVGGTLTSSAVNAAQQAVKIKTSSSDSLLQTSIRNSLNSVVNNQTNNAGSIVNQTESAVINQLGSL